MNTTSENEFRQNLNLPEPWATIGFDEATILIPTTNKKIKQRHYLQDGEIPIIDQGKELIGGYTNDPSMVLETALPVIVFGDHTQIFKYVDFDFAPGADGVKILQPKGFFVPKLYYYFLQCLDLPDKGYARHFQYLRKQVLHLPPFEEQERIVSTLDQLLSQLDMGVQSLLIVQKKIENYQSSILQASCEGRLVPTEAELAQQESRDYEPASVLLERILTKRRKKWEDDEWAKLIEKAKKKAAQSRRRSEGRSARISDLELEEWQDLSEEEYEKCLSRDEKWKQKYKEPTPLDNESLHELPRGWVWVSLGEISDVIGGLTVNPRRKDLPQTIPYLRVANVYANRLLLEEISEIGIKESEKPRVLLESGDMLVVEGNGSREQIGRVAIWDGSITPCAHQNHLIKVRFYLPEVGKYVLYWLLSMDGRDMITQVASSTSGLYTLNLSKVSSLRIPLPPLTEQYRITREIERLLSIADKSINLISSELLKTQAMTSSILSKAFRGNLVDQDPRDEPANDLLNRIRNR